MFLSFSSEVCTQSKACGACWGRGAAVRGRTVLMSTIPSLFIDGHALYHSVDISAHTRSIGIQPVRVTRVES